MPGEETTVVENFISKHEFFFETPLYEVIPYERIEEEDLDDFFEGDVDAYSAKNNIDTTYTIRTLNVDDYNSQGFRDFRKVKLICRRKPEDILYFFVWIGDDFIVKIGQLPSLADLQFAEIGKKYDKLLERADLQEFKKAIGLAAHGVGAGSFVYLRRIFEKLIDETFQNHVKALTISADDYRKQRMDEKVQTLADYLPSQLVGMKAIYSILSSGVHELSEQQCLQYFPALKLSIELILEQKIEAEQKKQRDEEAKKQIAAIEQSLKANK